MGLLVDEKLIDYVEVTLAEKGFGKGITVEESCKKLKKSDLVLLIKKQHELMAHLDNRVAKAITYFKAQRK